MIYRITENFTIRRILKAEKGFLLIAALTLLTALTLLGTTAYILSSTDIKIGGNFRNNQLTLQVAMAGAERAREALRAENLASSDTISFSDELNSSTRKGANSTLDGYTATTDDVPLTSGTMNNVSYAAYLTNDSTDGASNTTDSNNKVMITSVATGPNNSRAKVEMLVTWAPTPSSPGTLYSKGNVGGNGSALTISGNDAGSCGGSNLAPIYTKDPAETELVGQPNLSGSPATPVQGTLDIDIQSYINALKVGTTATLTEDQNNQDFGSATNYVTVFSDTSNPVNNQGLKIQNGTGYGILLVQGDLELGGGFSWNGLIFVTGTLTMNGGGRPINIQGQIFSGTTTSTDVDLNGSITIGYDSCQVKKAADAAPLKVVTWKQVY